MIKQSIATATLVLIQDAPEIIYYAHAIFDFTILAQYPLDNNEILFYMEHALYRLDNTKIAFENYCPINAKLFQPTFNYLKFYTMIHFVKCIQNYGNAINYDTTYSKTAHKYLLKAFHRRTNKKEYKSQILKYNICHINIIAM